MALCGPKLAITGMMLSIWGIIMLLFMGIFLRIHSPAFAEDLAIDQAVWAADEWRMEYVYGIYDQASTNCFIAAGMYVLLFGFSFIQHKINARNNYVMS